MHSDGDDPAKRNGDDAGERKGRNARGTSPSTREGTGLEWVRRGSGPGAGRWPTSGWKPSYEEMKYEEKSLAEREDGEKMMGLNIF